MLEWTKIILGDFFVQVLCSDSLLTECTMYGLYFIPDSNDCEVFRADISIGCPNVVYKGTKTKINDLINRVFSQIVPCDPSWKVRTHTLAEF